MLCLQFRRNEGCKKGTPTDLLYLYDAFFLPANQMLPLQKTLIRQFSNGEERLQKKQPIRNQDDSEFVYFPQNLFPSQHE